MTTIKIVHVEGDARARGAMLGRKIADRIHATFAFYYHQVFRDSGLNERDVVARAERLATIIGDYSETCRDELKGIADGAGIALWKLILLNARTEILNARVGVAECTAIFDQRTRVLAQTWDWIRELEDLMVLVHYAFPDGRQAITLTEPGMSAKIGFNSDGLGICLNFLASPVSMDGVPVHVVLRALLDCRSLTEAQDAITRSGLGKTSHILVATCDGQARGFEFAAGKLAVVQPQNGYLLHTNHCVADGLDSAALPSTFERFARASGQLRNGAAFDVDAMKKLLLDDSQGTKSIQCAYHPEEALGGFHVGTCATMIMDLGARTLHYRKGPERERPFERLSLATEHVM